MSDWQPISTAPKDGRRVILYKPGGDGDDATREVAEGSWGPWFGNKWAWYMEAGDGWDNPTHWMPMPDPPVKL